MSTTGASSTPARIGKYEIESELGRGGMGVVYRARDPRIGRLVALKTLTESLAGDGTMLQRFYREAERAGKLNHPNIVTIFDLGEHDGHPYIVMEFLVGETLEAIIRGGRDLPLVHRLKIVAEVCLALAHAHEHEVIHRDVKPLNVIILNNGSAKLLDFGLAVPDHASRDMALTAEGSIIGTTAYMAPERLSNAVVDGRADIFATGVMMFQLLTGALPFSGAGHEEVAHNILYTPHPSLQEFVAGYPDVLDQIIGRALQKEPSQRYQTADQMAADISSVMDSALKQYVDDLIGSAQQLGHALELNGAREKLEEVLRWAPQHTQARNMLTAVKQRLTERHRLELAEEKHRQAEQALLEKRYDAALLLLEEAHKLSPDNNSLAVLVQDVRQKQQLVARVNELCVDAEIAQRKGDFASARVKYEDAMQLDTQSSRLRLAYGKLLEDATRAENESKAKALLQEASASLKRRDFRLALTILERAEALDPANPQVHAMTGEAQDGLRAEERRLMLEDLETRIAAASSEEELSHVADLVGTILERMPGDASLLRFRLELDQHMHLYRDRRTVSDTAESCRRLLQADDLIGARECVHKALAQVPGNGHLLALAERIEERLRQEAQQNQRQTALLQANDALKRNDFQEAVRILTQCLRYAYSQDIADLLQTAEEQLALNTRREALASCHRSAQEAMRSEDYAAVIAAIEPVLEQDQDETLHLMLQKARAAELAHTAERGAALDQLRDLVARGMDDQAVAFAAKLGARVAADQDVVALVAGAVQAQTIERAQLNKLGNGYGALVTQNPQAHWASAHTTTQSAGVASTLDARMWASLAGRREVIANEVLLAHGALLRESAVTAEAVVDSADLDRVKAFAGFASSNVAREWSAQVAHLLPDSAHRLGKRVKQALRGASSSRSLSGKSR